MIVAVVGILGGISLIVAGGLGLSQSGSSSSSDSVDAQLAAAGFPTNVQVAVLIESSSARTLTTADIGPIYVQLRKIPGVRSVDAPRGNLFNHDTGAALMPVEMEPGIDAAAARRTVHEAITDLEVPQGLTLAVPGSHTEARPGVADGWKPIGFGIAVLVLTGGLQAFPRFWQSETTPAPDSTMVLANGATATAHHSRLSDTMRRERAQFVAGGLFSLQLLVGLLGVLAVFDVAPSLFTRVPSLAMLITAAGMFGQAIRITRDARRNTTAARNTSPPQ